VERDGRYLLAPCQGGSIGSGTLRCSRHATVKADLRGRIPDTVSIRDRPAEAEDRAVPGHWEGDLLWGSANSYLVTLVERQTRFLMIAKIANRDTRSVVNALIKQAKQLPEQLYRSLTWDRGMELTDHKRFTSRLMLPCTFATHRVLGNEARTRTPIACYDNTSRSARIFRFTLRHD
jgi:IS30 family transposase